MQLNTHKVIFHIDMDAFFASCMQNKYKELKNKPIVISRNDQRSIVTAASYEARKFGIKSAMPIFQVKKLLPDIKIIEPDYPLFSEISSKIWDLIDNEFTTEMEIASIDECYVDATNSWNKYGSPKNMALRIQERIYQQFGFTCSIGISYNKFLAKMASDMNKPNGLTILSPNLFYQKIWPLKIEDMLGVGIRTAQILKDNKINTIGDLAKADDKLLISILGENSLKIKQNALGKNNDKIVIENIDVKSISNEITLNNPTDNLEELEDLIFALTTNVCQRLVKRQMKAKSISIIIRYENKFNSSFDKLEHIKHKRKQETLEEYSSDLEIIFSLARYLFNEIYNKDKIVTLIGVGISGLKRDKVISKQLTFSQDSNYNNSNKILIDNINNRIGNIILKSGEDYEKQISLTKTQGKFSKTYDAHILNKELRNKDKK